MRPTHARGKQSGRSLVEAKADCVTERDMQKYLSFIMYNGSALLLFTRKLHCLQTFLQITAR